MESVKTKLLNLLTKSSKTREIEKLQVEINNLSSTIPDVPKHKHRFKLIKQVSLPLSSYHNYYQCECGAKTQDYENPKRITDE